jgi:hypothetical protein
LPEATEKSAAPEATDHEPPTSAVPQPPLTVRLKLSVTSADAPAVVDPDKGMVRGPAPRVEITRLADFDPAEVGAKVTLTGVLEPLARITGSGSVDTEN